MTPADDDDLIAGPDEELRPEPEFRPIGQPARKRGRRGLWVGIALVVVAGAAGAGSWVYLNGWPFGGSESEVPLIHAETGPIKVQPESPGGMEVPDQDKLVYDRMEGATGDRETVERLLPPPETPMPKPMPLPGPLTEAQPGQPATAAPPAGASAPAAPSASASAAQQSGATAAPPPPPAPAPGATAAAPPPSTTAPTVQEVLGAMRPPPPPAEAKPSATAKPQVAAIRPAPSPAAQGGYKVQLAAVRSRADVDKEWGRLKRQQSDLLGNLELSVMRADLGPGKGVFFRLRAGPLANEAAAKALCAKLAERKVGCLVVRPEG